MEAGPSPLPLGCLPLSSAVTLSNPVGIQQRGPRFSLPLWTSNLLFESSLLIEVDVMGQGPRATATWVSAAGVASCGQRRLGWCDSWLQPFRQRTAGTERLASS